MALEIDESIMNTQKDNLLKIKKSLDASVDNMNTTLKSISNDWKSSASDQLCKNIKKSLTSFQTYIDELKNASNFMGDFVNQVNAARGKSN